jgi:hypothetical protein
MVSETFVCQQLIVRDAAGNGILLVAESHAWSLPSFELPDRHTAETDYINQVALERFGIEVTVLRCLDDTRDGNKTIRTYEMELHGADPPDTSGLRWFDRDEIIGLSGRFHGDRAGVEKWFTKDSLAHDELPNWQRVGWWRAATDWIADRIVAKHSSRIVKMIQRRQWGSSCVIEIICDEGKYFFKATPQKSCERDLAVFLARHSPAVPRVVAVHPQHNWMLMRAFAGSSLEESCDLARWAAGLAAYAEIQLRCTSMTAELTRLGCQRLDMKKVSDDIDALLSDSVVLCEGEPDGLSVKQIEYLRTKAPGLKRGCARLAASAVPLTIEHGDLWPGNILVNETGCAILDWEDARLAHPFFSAAPLIAGMETYQPEMSLRDAHNRFCEIYVRAFARFGDPKTLREMFAVALPIAMLETAIRYWRQPPAMVAVNPWMRTLVPYFAGLPYRTLGVDDDWPDSAEKPH